MVSDGIWEDGAGGAESERKNIEKFLKRYKVLFFCSDIIGVKEVTQCKLCYLSFYGYVKKQGSD